MSASPAINSYEAQIKPKVQLFQIVLIFFFSVALLAVGFMGLGNVLKESAGVWFAKSGACVTALTIVLGHKIQSFGVRVSPYLSMTTLEIESVREKWGPWVPRLQLANLSLGVLSALIWGYGDTLVALIEQANL